MTGSVVFKAVDDAVIGFLDNMNLTPKAEGGQQQRPAAASNAQQASTNEKGVDAAAAVVPELQGVPVVQSELYNGKEDKKIADNSHHSLEKTYTHPTDETMRSPHPTDETMRSPRNANANTSSSTTTTITRKNFHQLFKCPSILNDEEIGVVAMAREVQGNLIVAHANVSHKLAPYASKGSEYFMSATRQATTKISEVATTVKQSETGQMVSDNDIGIVAMIKEIGQAIHIPVAYKYLEGMVSKMRAVSCNALEVTREKVEKVPEALALDDKSVHLNQEVDCTPIGMIREASTKIPKIKGINTGGCQEQQQQQSQSPGTPKPSIETRMVEE